MHADIEHADRRAVEVEARAERELEVERVGASVRERGLRRSRRRIRRRRAFR
jgi:hypothetical protein